MKASEVKKGDSIVTRHYGVMVVTDSRKSRRYAGEQQIQGETSHGFKQIELKRIEEVEEVKIV